MFGLPVAGKGRYWGARAIYSGYAHNYHIDLLPDRQHVEPDSDADPDPKARKAFFRWVDKVGLPWLRKEVKRKALGQDSGEMLSFRDGRYRIHACCNCSYGYLYIGARED
jgi:hypothetical protein